MLTTFRNRFLSIALPQIAGMGIALVTVLTNYSVLTIIIAFVSFIGFGVILLFWTVFFLSFPNIRLSQHRILVILYRIGQVAFVLILTIGVGSVFTLAGEPLHWLLVGLNLLECSEHFMARWLDGNGKLFTQRPSHAWMGGAAGIALRHSVRRIKQLG